MSPKNETKRLNSFRVTYNDTSNSLNDPPDKFFDAPEVGVKLYTYVPGTMALAVTDGFTISGGNSVKVHTGRGSNTAKNLYWRSDSYIWNNDGDTATLKKKNGVVADKCSYAGGSPGYKMC